MCFGRSVIGDDRVVDTFGAPSRKNDLILAFVRYQRRLTNNWGATVVSTQHNRQIEWQEGRIDAPVNEDVGVFATDIFWDSALR